MKKINEMRGPFGRLLSPSGIVLVILSLGLIMPYATFAQRDRTDARVLSTAASTTQTQNVNVVNTPTVQANQSGSWNVGINGTPTVAVGNTTASPVPVASVVSTPFQQTVSMLMNAGSNSGIVSFDVPTGYRLLVIEHVSAYAALTNGQQLITTRIDIQQTVGGPIIGHYFVATPQGSVTGIGDYFAISQPVRLYAAGTVGFWAARSDTAGLVQITFAVSGYLVQ